MSRLPMALALLVLSVADAATAGEKVYTVGILNWMRAPHTLEAIEGFRRSFDMSQVPHTFNVVDAGADEAKARETLRRWKQDKVDLIFAVGTAASLLAVEEARETPVVFIAAPHPALSRPADGPCALGDNATGSSTWVDMTTRLRLFQECLPRLARLGVVYDPDDPVAAAEVAEARDKVKSLDITLHEATATKPAEIAPAAEKLTVQKIDALWVPTDSLVCSNLSQIARLARARKLPVLTSAQEAMAPVEGDGVAMVAVAADYGELGRLSAQTALDVLTAGSSPGDIPIRSTSPHVVIVNADIAATLGQAVPPSFLAKAHRVLRGYEGQLVTIAGTGDSQDLLRALAKALLAKVEGGRIEVPESIGSSGGIRALLGGRADLARVARELKPDEVRAGLTCKTFALAPVVFVAHPNVTGIDNVIAADVVGIYSGRIIKWDVLGGRGGKIYAVTRESGDACLGVLTERLPGLADIKEPRAKVVYSSTDARDALVGHRNTFGFLVMSVAASTDLQILRFDGVYPSAENVRNGKYKLVVPLGIVYKQEPEGLARRFVDFLYSKEARAIIADMGAVPVDTEDQ